MHASRILLGLAVAVLLPVVSGCSTVFEQHYDEAETLRQQAAQRGYEWIGTAGLLEQAQHAADRGETDLALQLVEQARFQARAALRQADVEAEAWRSRVVRKKE